MNSVRDLAVRSVSGSRVLCIEPAATESLRAKQRGCDVHWPEFNFGASPSEEQQIVCEFETQLAERIEQHRIEVRQLQADVADREAFIEQFRVRSSSDRSALDRMTEEVQRLEALLDAERATSHRARVEAAERSERLAEETAAAKRMAALQVTLQASRSELAARLAFDRDQLTAARSELNRVKLEVTGARSELDHVKVESAAAHRAHAQQTTQIATLTAELAALRAYASSAGFQLIERTSLALRRHPRTYGVLQSIVRKIAAR